MTDLSALNALLKASSKQVVEKVVNLAFTSRSGAKEVVFNSWQ
jgi:hypothetical protein